LLVVAKTDAAFTALREMFRTHAVRRTYQALVRGAVPHDVFAVEAPLGRRAARIVVDATGGRSAETGFEVLERFPGATLLTASPRTGRTHQIRVHLASIGHPVLGDRAYGGGGEEARRLGLDRPFLHSWRLSFEHPITGAAIDLEEPLPDDLEPALAAERGRPWAGGREA
jgi:23S rRNA pseudouridine1911/1915/1917 synthase